MIYIYIYIYVSFGLITPPPYGAHMGPHMGPIRGSYEARGPGEKMTRGPREWDGGGGVQGLMGTSGMDAGTQIDI